MSKVGKETEYREQIYSGHVIEGDLEAIVFNVVVSAIPKFSTFKPLRLDNEELTLVTALFSCDLTPYLFYSWSHS
jgi:hypothetical protein